MSEKQHKVEFHRRGNRVLVSVRNKETGAVKLQWDIELEELFNQIFEDYNERTTNTS